jgi:transketolase
MLASIPHVQLYNLTCSDEAEALVGQAVDEFAAEAKKGHHSDSYVFFLGRENFPANYGTTSFKLGQAQVVRDSASPKVVIAAGGALLGQALTAAEALAKDGIEAVVINPSIMNKPDVATFKKYLDKCGGKLVTAEDHQVIGGMGAILTHALLQDGVSLKVKSLGVKGEFGQSAYTALELYKKHGLDSTAIAAAARELSR